MHKREKRQIVDTIGFNENERKGQLQRLSEYVKGKANLVIYCLCIGPGSKFNDTEAALMQSLQKFGNDIWKHCMVVLTCSNCALDNYSDECEENQHKAIAEYKKCIDDYTQSIQRELKELSVQDVVAKNIFELEKLNSSVLPVIPAGKKTQDQVIPGHENWKDVVFEHMLLKCEECKSPILQLQLLFKMNMYGLEVLEL